MYKILITILLTFCTPQIINALPIQKLTPHEGLSNRHTFKSIKDDDGYLWFITYKGIDKYNGEKFVHYYLNNPQSGLNRWPRGIVRDKNNNIYVFSKTFIYKYDSSEDEFLQFSELPFPEDEVINEITFSPTGIMWVGTNKILYQLQEKHQKHHLIAKVNIPVFSLRFIDSENGWLGSSKGIFRLKLSKDYKYEISRCNGLDFLDDKLIQTIFYDRLTKYLWIGTFSNGIYLYDTTTGTFTNLSKTYERDPVRTITTIGKNHIWVGMDGGGIYEYNRFNGKLTNCYSQESIGKNNISTNSIYHILDDERLVWICTYTEGIFLINKNHLVTNIYENVKYNSQSLINGHVNCILEDSQNRLWFGTNQGISRFDSKNKKWKHLVNNQKGKTNVILSLIEDHKGDIWVGGYSCNLMRIDSNDKIHVENIPDMASGNKKYRYVFSLHEDLDGYIWMGGINPLGKYNPQTKTIQQYPIQGITQITSLNEQTLLIVTHTGILTFDKTTEKSKYIFSDLDTIEISAEPTYICTSPDFPDLLWIGTKQRGLLRYDLSTKEVKQYTQEDGLTSMDIWGIQYDLYGRLWLSTENGLNCLNINHNQIEVFDEKDGLINNVFTPRACHKLRNGNILFGTPSGAIEINPAATQLLSKNQGNLHFEEFALFNTPISPQDENSPLRQIIDKTDHIILNHKQNSFSFDFLNVGYFNTYKNQYSWILESFDNTWTTASNRHYAVYTNIPPGNYTFRVKVPNGTEQKNYQERKIKVTIKPPWWNTFWAWLCYLLILSVLVYQLSRMYKHKIDMKDSERKIKFFINLAHDIRTPLTLIKAPLNEINEEKDHLSTDGKVALVLAQRNTEKLQNMVTQLLDFQKAERKLMKLQVELTNINYFINNIVLNFEPFAKQSQIQLHCLLSEQEANGYIDRHKLTIVLENLISNSIKYSYPLGNIWIKQRIDKEILYIDIIDEGMGISVKDQKRLFNRFFRGDNAVNSKETGSGIGLLLTKKMTELHKGSINFSSKEGKGSVFQIQIPISQNSYNQSEILVRDEAFQRQETESYENELQDSKQIKLMIVEDDEDMRNYLSHYLNRHYHVTECCNGQEALAYLQKVNPDLIISDVIMPIMSGLDFCRKLKSNIETCHIPIILLTSLTEREDLIKGLDAGADDYLTKPFDPSILSSKIVTIIKNRRLFYKKYIDKSVFDDNSVTISEMDKKFMKQVIQYIENNMMYEDFNIDSLALEMAMSRSAFYNKIKSLTKQSPQNFIRDIKMKRAASLLCKHTHSISEIAYMTGYPNTQYFSTAFKKYYGQSPSSYVDQNKAS